MESETGTIIKTESIWAKLFALTVVIAVSVAIAISIPDYANDFTCFYEAGVKVASGISPYSVECYFSPIWVAMMFTPLSFFTREIAYRIYAVILFGGYFYILWKISKQNILMTLIAGFTPFVYMTMQYGNIDWLVLLGFISPMALGIWLVLVKPQMGFTLALLWAWKTYRQHGVKRLFLIFGPVAIGFLISFALGMRIPDPETLAAWSADVWPYGLLLGIPFLIYAFRKQEDDLALAAAPFLTPYTGPMSWAAILPTAMRNKKLLALVWVFSWILIILWRLKL